MNERIKELVEQATIRGVEYRPGDDGHPTPTFYFDREKFAELIVQECMDLVKDCYAEPGIDQSPYQTVCASTIIEEYFGVEE